MFNVGPMNPPDHIDDPGEGEIWPEPVAHCAAGTAIDLGAVLPEMLRLSSQRAAEYRRLVSWLTESLGSFRDLTKTMVPMSRHHRPTSNHGHHVVPLDPSPSQRSWRPSRARISRLFGLEVAMGASVVAARWQRRLSAEELSAAQCVAARLGVARLGVSGWGWRGWWWRGWGEAVGVAVGGGAVVGGSVQGGSVVGASVRGGRVSGGSVSEGRVTSGRVSGGSVTAPLDGGPVPRPGGAVTPGGRVTDGAPPPEHDIVRIAAAADRTTNPTARIA